MTRPIPISTDYIALGQFLKLADVIETGGQVKWFLQHYQIHVNGELENRRGKKLYPGDIIHIEEVGSFKVIQDG